jgi:hypothetical protein
MTDSTGTTEENYGGSSSRWLLCWKALLLVTEGPLALVRFSGDPPLVASATTHQLGRPRSVDKELGRLAVSFDIQWPMWSDSDNADCSVEMLQTAETLISRS